MKTSKSKPDCLSLNQRLIWHYVTTSEHPLSTIAVRSGYSEQGIKNWMFGVFEPQQVAVDNLTATIDILSSERPTSINWKLKNAKLAELMAEQKTVKQISEILQTTQQSARNAVARLEAQS